MQQLTPICDEQLWIQNFDVVNEIFTTLPVVVTLVVMFFHYREVDSQFLPTMVTASRSLSHMLPRTSHAGRLRLKNGEDPKARFITSLKKEEQVIDSHHSHHSHHRHHRHHL